MLDMTEGPCQIRKKLAPNPNFYALYPYRPELELGEKKSFRYKVAVSLDAKKHFHLFDNNRCFPRQWWLRWWRLSIFRRRRRGDGQTGYDDNSAGPASIVAPQ